jgi:DNA repair protein RecN (Recombination protein N)
MLKSVYIKNYAIIEEISISFNEGLNIITGPSGSGKTLIVKALSFLIGSNLEKKFLSLDNTVIEGFFRSEEKEYVLRRVFNLKSTKNYINDEPVKVSEYKKIAAKLMDINDQQEKYKLLDKEHHIEVLDSFSGSIDQLELYRHRYLNYSRSLNDLDVLNDERKSLIEMYDLYTYQLDELSQFNISETEENEVFKELKKLLNHKEVASKVETLKGLIYSNPDSMSSFSENIKNISSDIKEYDSILLSVYESIKSISIEINEINNELNRYDGSSNFQSDIIEKLERQSSFYETIKRKYGGTLESAVNYKSLIVSKLDRHEKIDFEIEKLRKIIEDEKRVLIEMAQKLQKIRFENKDMFLNMVKKGLLSLKMKDIDFDLKFKANSDLSPTGLENCEFLVSFNKGVSKLPLKDVASGGELSRVVLIIKNISSNLNTPIVFDEIDTGVSGEIADNLGKLLVEISRKSQVICVTHLPQVAAKGSSHFYITKKTGSDKTVLDVKELDSESRIDEIAKMISGDIIHESSMEHAKNILKN